MKFNSIEAFLNRVRLTALKRDAQKLGWMLYTFFLIGFILMILLEAQLYLSSDFREAFKGAIINGFFIFIAVAAVYIFLLLTNRVPRYKTSRLAQVTGKLSFPKSDTVINALQLERDSASTTSNDLKKAYIQEIISKLNQLDINSIFPVKKARSWKAASIIMLVLVASILLLKWESTGSAVYRWSHSDQEFYAPPPFSINSLSGDVHLLGGGKTALEIVVEGAKPDTVFMELTSPGKNKEAGPDTVLFQIPDLQGHYVFTVNNVHKDYDYRAFVPAEHFWEPWKEVSSLKHRILVTDRPLLEQFQVTITGPDYSKLEPVVQSENQANISGLKGSTIQIDLRSNLPLEKAMILRQDDAIDMDISGMTASGSFILEKNDEIMVRILDTRGIANTQPIPYVVTIVPDTDPQLTVITPEDNIQIPGNQKVPYQLEIEDDFGFSTLQIGYEIHRPDFLGIEPVFSIYGIPGLNLNEKLQTIDSHWDISGINLMPGDEIHFHFELYDNDVISGPKKAISRNFIASIPTLEALYESFDIEEDSLIDALHVTAEEIKSLSEELEKSELQLLKTEKLDWEDKQQAEKLLDEAKAQIEELKKLESAISELSEMGEENALFSKDLLEKFNTLKNLIQELIKDDLIPDLNALEQALEEMNSSDIQSAIEKMRKNMDRLEKELDRYIDIFKRVQSEQKMEELANRISQLMKQQSLVEEKIRKLDQNSDPQNFEQLSQEQYWNLEEFDKLIDEMKLAAKQLQEFSEQTKRSLDELAKSSVVKETESDMGRVSRDLKRQELKSSKQYSYSALENLERIQQEFQKIQNNFQNETSSQMAEDLRKAMRMALVVSKNQEKLSQSSKFIPRNSPRFRDLASDQQLIQKQLSAVTAELIKLSKQTFAITPAIGKAIGTANAHMETAKLSLAERQGRQAVEAQEQALTFVNKTIQLLNQSSNSMESSGSASGFEQFLKQMEELTGQQQALNNESMQLSLGQMTASMQQSLLERLAARQQQVKKSLEKLMNEMEGSGTNPLGDLGQVSKDMDEVVKEMMEGRFDQRTVNRQQKILSRMLDSQRSITQRGEKEERISRQADDYIVGTGPGGLPENLGQRRSITMEALNRSMKAGYPSDYQDMITRYFHALSKMEAFNTSKDSIPGEQNRINNNE